MVQPIKQGSDWSKLLSLETPDVLPFGEDAAFPGWIGRYELVRPLGRGGMGTVYLAHDSALDRRVALKIPHRASSDADRSRIYREARAAAAVTHAHICPLYDVDSDNGRPFIVMQYIAGETLDQQISGNGVPTEKAIRVAIRIAAALTAAHRAGVVHRDLKPANILMRADADPVITDFGLAKRVGDRIWSDQRPRLLGSPAYMAPEQVRGAVNQIGPATDVYGLGTILYQMLTGCRPFGGAVPEIYSHVLLQTPEAPTEIRQGLDPRLDTLCLRAMAKDPSQRFRSAAEMHNALVNVLKSPPAKHSNSGSTMTLAAPQAESLAEAMYRLKYRPSGRKSARRKGWRQRIRRLMA